MKSIIFMDYYARFQCTGGACPMTCCGGWNIKVNPSELEMYKRLSGAFGKKVVEAIDENKCCFKQEESLCTLLTKDGWCRIVREYGEEYLTQTCAVFPRYIVEFGSIGEALVEIVCPEVAGYLFGLRQIEFGIEEIEEETYIEIDQKKYAVLAELRAFMIEIWQENRKRYYHGKILLILKVQELIKNLHKMNENHEILLRKIKDIKNLLIGNVRNKNEFEDYGDVQKYNLEKLFQAGEVIRIQKERQKIFLFSFFDMVLSGKWVSLLNDKLKMILNFEVIYSRWLPDADCFYRDLEAYLLYFREQYFYFPENYFIYFLFRDFIPQNLDMKRFGKLMLVHIMEFAVIQLFACLLWIQRREILVEEFSVIIAGVDRVFSHSTSMEKELFQYVEKLSEEEMLLLLLV